MAAITANTGSNNWNTNGAWVGAVQPTAADDVTIPASAVITIPTATTVLGRSLTVAASGTLVFATTTSILSLGDATAGAGNVALSIDGTATITLTGLGTINFLSTSTTVQTVTTGSLAMPNLTFNGAGGKWQFTDGFINTACAITLVTGTLDLNGKTFDISNFSMTGSATRTITFGAANITLRIASNLAFNGGSSGGATVTANTTTITFTGAGSGGSTGSQNWNGLSLIFNGSGTAFWTSNGTIKNITRNGTAVTTDGFIITTSCTISGALTILGNSAINRVLFSSNVVGTQITVTDNGTAPTLTNVDFKDMKSAGTAGTWTGTSLGDCGGNSGITFTTPVTRYAVVAGNLSSTATWSSTTGGAGGSSVPLPQDNVFFDAGSAAGTYTQDMPRMGTTFDFTNFTRTFSVGASNWETYGSWIMAAGMTAAGNITLTLAGRASYVITTAAKPMYTIKLSAPTGTYTLTDNMTIATSGGLTLSAGTFIDAGFTVNLTAVGGAVAVSGATVTLTGAWNFSATNAITFWSVSSGSVTATSANFSLITASANTRTFAGGGGSYGTFNHTVAGSTGKLTVTGSNSFQDILFTDSSNARTLSLTSGTTTTIRSTKGFRNLRGTSGKLMTVNASIGASPATIALPNGTAGDSNFLSVQDITATTNTWYAGSGSTNVSGNTNVTFGSGPVVNKGNFFSMT